MRKLAILLAVLLCAGGIFATTANAVSISIDVGDRPYYSHGPGYWSGHVYYVWVPGHWAWRNHHKVWIHGHYRVR
jgi:hypothetical protein